MREARSYPALFHRVFLSHLLVLLLCFAAAVILVDYLFAEGVTLFILRSPIILIPALLALMGLVGLLALWTAASTAVPLDHASTLLNECDPSERLLQLLPKAGTEEVARLLIATQQRLAREESRTPLRPLFLRIDTHLNVLDCDIDTAARLGYTPDELRRLNVRDILSDQHSLQDFRHVFNQLNNREIAIPFSCPFRAAGQRILQTSCTLYAMPDAQILLIGIVGRFP
ncbi:MAG: PAS domain-containing protein [Bacteroidota bacterium]